MEVSTNFEGIIEITRIENSGDNDIKIGTLTARFVRYPGCQQLQVWLPESGYGGYGQIRLIDFVDNILIEEYPVANKLNGSVQMLWDTLTWRPGQYRIEIEHPGKGLHYLYCTKREVDSYIPENGIVEMPMARAGSPSLVTDLVPKQELTEEDSSDSLWKIYMDGFGNPIPNFDQQIRDRAFEGLKESFESIPEEDEAELEFDDKGRGGYISYIYKEISIRFWYEGGAGDCKMFIEVPGKNVWEKETGVPLEKRREVLLFVASGVKRHFAVAWRFEIDDCSISLF